MTESIDQALPLSGSGKPASALPVTPTRALARRTVLAAATLILGIGLGAYLGPEFQHSASPSIAPGAETPIGNAAGTGTPMVQTVAVGALGRLMPEDDTTTLALPFASSDARVARLLVREGQRITTGQLVAELDNLPLRLAQRARAAAELAAKQAALDQARSAARLSQDEALAAHVHARAARQLANRELMRVSDLAKVGMATRSQLDQAEAKAAQAAADQAKGAAAIQRFSGRDSDTQPDVQLAIRNIAVAKAALAQAEQELAGARILATLDGTVIAIHVRVGEKPGDRGIATLGNTDRMGAELEVYQTDIRHIALGQAVVLTAASLDSPLTGTVSQIGLEVRRQAVLAADPVSNTDARIVKVRVALDKPSSERSRTLSGLQVVGKITAGIR